MECHIYILSFFSSPAELKNNNYSTQIIQALNFLPKISRQIFLNTSEMETLTLLIILIFI
jgi:hypothetical protein